MDTVKEETVEGCLSALNAVLKRAGLLRVDCAGAPPVKTEINSGGPTIGLPPFPPGDHGALVGLRDTSTSEVVLQKHLRRSVAETFGAYYLTVWRDDDGMWDHAMHENLKDAWEHRCNVRDHADVAIFKLTAL